MRIESFIEMDENSSIEEFVFGSLKYVTNQMWTELHKKYMYNGEIIELGKVNQNEIEKKEIYCKGDISGYWKIVQVGKRKSRVFKINDSGRLDRQMIVYSENVYEFIKEKVRRNEKLFILGTKNGIGYILDVLEKETTNGEQ